MPTIVDGNFANRRVERKANRILIVMRVINPRGFAPKSSKEEFADILFRIDEDVLNLHLYYGSLQAYAQ